MCVGCGFERLVWYHSARAARCFFVALHRLRDCFRVRVRVYSGLVHTRRRLPRHDVCWYVEGVRISGVVVGVKREGF